MIHRAARLVAMAINGALQPDYNPLSSSPWRRDNPAGGP